MITAERREEKVKAIEAGADDFIPKPFDQAELIARIRSLLRIKRYHDTIETQAAELERWNAELERASGSRSTSWRGSAGSSAFWLLSSSI